MSRQVDTSLKLSGDPAFLEEQHEMVWKGEGRGSYTAASYKEFEKGHVAAKEAKDVMSHSLFDFCCCGREG